MSQVRILPGAQRRKAIHPGWLFFFARRGTNTVRRGVERSTTWSFPRSATVTRPQGAAEREALSQSCRARKKPQCESIGAFFAPGTNIATRRGKVQAVELSAEGDGDATAGSGRARSAQSILPGAQRQRTVGLLLLPIQRLRRRRDERGIPDLRLPILRAMPTACFAIVAPAWPSVVLHLRTA
jgi:hypothetical protein